MSAMPALIVHRAVRTWTRLYICRLPADVQIRRRAEIESDLREFERDRGGRAPRAPGQMRFTAAPPPPPELEGP